jgi:CheY-like chemotaxis protein
VDDHPGSREALRETILRWGGDAYTAEHGATALRAARTAARVGQPFGLLLIDLHMPDMDGFAIARSVLEDPALAPCKVMIMTAAGRPGDGARCASLGVAGYLLKPVLPTELLESVQAALGMAGAAEVGPGLVTRHLLRERRATLRILVAEDEPVNRRVIRGLLEKRGHRVEVVPDGELAVERAATGLFDLVLMDVRMPIKDGLEATRLIRDLEQSTGQHLPIVALTAHAMREQREECLSAGMDGYLSKPLNPEALWNLLDHFGRDLPGEGHEDGRTRSQESRSRVPTPAGPPAFDVGFSLQLVDGDPRLLRELLGTFLEDSEDQAKRLEAGLEAQLPGAVASAAHRLKGSAANFKARRLTDLAAKVESAGLAEDLPSAGRLFPDMLAALREVTVAMKRLVTEDCGGNQG